MNALKHALNSTKSSLLVPKLWPSFRVSRLLHPLVQYHGLFKSPRMEYFGFNLPSQKFFSSYSSASRYNLYSLNFNLQIEVCVCTRLLWQAKVSLVHYSQYLISSKSCAGCGPSSWRYCLALAFCHIFKMITNFIFTGLYLFAHGFSVIFFKLNSIILSFSFYWSETCWHSHW